MRRRVLIAGLLVLIASACSDRLGRDVPECAAGITNSIVMEIQAVPTATNVPCLNALEVGWKYHDLVPRRGTAEFTLGSDRMGDPFLTVRTTESCEVTGQEVISDERQARLYRTVVEDLHVRVVIVPVGQDEITLQAALQAVDELHGTMVNGRQVETVIDEQNLDTAERIRSAAASGAHVIVIDVRNAEEGTVTLVRAGETTETRGPLWQAVKQIEDLVAAPSYTGSWFYVFDGGCTEYRFAAKGPGAERVASDVRRVLTFVDAEAIKATARSQGFDIP